MQRISRHWNSMQDKTNTIEDIKAHIASRRLILSKYPALIEEYKIELMEAIIFWEKELEEMKKAGVA